MSRFDGATVLITGAAGGLGRGAAKGFAVGGARLIEKAAGREMTSTDRGLAIVGSDELT